MWSFPIIVDQIFEEFVLQLLKAVKICIFDQIFFECTPEAFHLAVGLRAVRLHITPFYACFDQHTLERVISFVLTNSRTKLWAIISDDFFELDAEFSFKCLHAMHSCEHSG